MKHTNPIYLQLSEQRGKLPSAASRFWGNPDLPANMDYPMYTDDEGDDYPYCFLCQINLEELAKFAPENPLPQKGLLSFFAKIDRYLGYEVTENVAGHISQPSDVKVIYIPDIENLREVILLDDDGEETSPQEMKISFARTIRPTADDHALFAAPTHREWDTWDEPFENWEILLQVDSFEGKDFNLNFMDCGVLDFLISPEDLTHCRLDNVRAIVLST